MSDIYSVCYRASCVSLRARVTELEAALAKREAVPALHRYKNAACSELDSETALDRLRFFLSLALSPQDWIDVEPFLDSVRDDAKRDSEAVVKNYLTTAQVADVLEKVREYGGEMNSAGHFEAAFERAYARELRRNAEAMLSDIEAMLAASQQAKEQAQAVNLRYSILRAADAGEQRHAQTVMRALGITYREAIPQSLCDQWWFLGCENVPAELPAFLSVMETKP